MRNIHFHFPETCGVVKIEAGANHTHVCGDDPDHIDKHSCKECPLTWEN